MGNVEFDTEGGVQSRIVDSTGIDVTFIVQIQCSVVVVPPEQVVSCSQHATEHYGCYGVQTILNCRKVAQWNMGISSISDDFIQHFLVFLRLLDIDLQ